jgi:hypothetical protein
MIVTPQFQGERTTENRKGLERKKRGRTHAKTRRRGEGEMSTGSQDRQDDRKGGVIGKPGAARAWAAGDADATKAPLQGSKVGVRGVPRAGALGYLKVALSGHGRRAGEISLT